MIVIEVKEIERTPLKDRFESSDVLIFAPKPRAINSNVMRKLCFANYRACSIDSLMLPAGGCDSDVGMRLARTRIRKVCPECDQIRDPAIVGFWNLLWYSLDVLLVYSPGRLYGEVGGWGNDRSVSLCKEDSERVERDKEIEKVNRGWNVADE
uniref:Uncharacterized protein n=1 Tax=Vespula pensylvanica TaxID=30213 RepID=A0A834UAR9_VESPE|nr:hypothetical protein H0235_006582 [Vespula pensylvanica]